MPRIRTIKPEFPQSESMGRVSREARLCFILLWTLADDEGRLRGNSRMLASLLYPYDDDAGQLMEGWLSELGRESCLRRYKHDGDSYVQLCNWLKHQKIDHASKSKIPPCEDVSRSLDNPREDSWEDQGSRIKESIKEQEDTKELMLVPPAERHSKKNKEKLPLELPNFISQENWDGWIEMRKSMKKVPTQHALELALKKLVDWHKKGYDTAWILQQSILNCWVDVYCNEGKTPKRKIEYREATPEDDIWKDLGCQYA